MKVLLINPDLSSAPRWARRYKRAWPPLDLLTSAALLREKGHAVALIDGRAHPVPLEDMRREAAAADLVVLHSSPLDRWQCPDLNWAGIKSLAEALPADKLILSGAHGTMRPEFVLQETGARAVIRGEPEAILSALVEAGGNRMGIEGLSYASDERLVHEPDAPPLDLDLLPLPAYDLIDLDHYGYELLGGRLALLEASRGCPFSCTFCLKVMYGSGIRRKSADRVMDEVGAVISRGARSLYFMDLEFTLDREFVTNLCHRLIDLNTDLKWCCQTRADTVDIELVRLMKQAGCGLIHLGVETGSKIRLEEINKKITLDSIRAGVEACRAADVPTACFFLFGLPNETEADRRATIALARELNPTYASFHPAAPYPGTDLYELDHSGGIFPACLEPEHDPEVLAGWVKRAYFSFYLRPSYILSRLTEGSLGEKWRRLKLFLEFVR